MSALGEYERVCAIVRGKEYWAVERSEVADAADAVIAELEMGNVAARRAADKWYTTSAKHHDELVAMGHQLEQAEAERDAATNAMDNLARKLTEAEEERDKWADSFKQAEAALAGELN